MGMSPTAKAFVPRPVRRAPLDHQALLTLARKLHAAAADCDCGHMDAAAKEFAGALGVHLRHETFTEAEITPGLERTLRRGQVRLWSAANDLLTEADRGCPHSPSYCTSRTEELLALLTIQADDERRAFSHQPHMKAQDDMSPTEQIVQPAPAVAPEDGSAEELRVLSRGECVELLSSHRLGRLAFAVGRQAKIFPVNYLLDGDSVVVRTGYGFKQAGAPMRDVAFEIDGAGADGAWGWSVIVEGTCFDVTWCLDTTSERERELPIRPWPPGQREQWLRITAEQISGRAFGKSPELAAAYSTSPLLH